MIGLGTVAMGLGSLGQVVERAGNVFPGVARDGPPPASRTTGATAYDLRDVTVIVVSYNSAHCLPFLGQSLCCGENITVVDNASQDGTAAAVARHLPQARFVGLDRNLGFGAANNIALRAVRTPFALLLNPDRDTAPADIARLVEAAHVHPRAAILAPQLLRQDGQPDINYRWPRGAWTSRGIGADGPVCVGFVSGAAMLLRIGVKDLGFFDEAFFLDYQDDDLCQRLFNARREIILVPEVVALHRSRGSVRGPHPWYGEYLRGYHHAQSKVTLAGKHHSPARSRAQRGKLLWLTALTLPLRVLLYAPKLTARKLGRLRGLVDWIPEQRHT